jgi:hypothetical protein
LFVAVTEPFDCEDCNTLLGQAARAIQTHLDALASLGQAVLTNREDISDLEKVFRDARQARKEAVENYQFHYAAHIEKFSAAGGYNEPSSP